jgi:WXXGXW repeat (2 copies)
MRRLCALFTVLPALAAVSPAPAHAQLISITIAPPALPVYVQPAIPAPGYIWTPGYWAYGDAGYFWVPGTWVLPPSAGLLWTPGYWGWRSGIYAWNAGYWGPTVGFYGGVNYGFGYGGVGFAGGEWRGGVFAYNRSVNNFGTVNITNVYNKTVIVNNNHVAFNGGSGGLTNQPTATERVAMSQPHTAPTAIQTQHQHTAGTLRENFASVNHGAPTVAATAHAGQFSGAGVVGAHGTPNAGSGLAHGPGAVGAASANAGHTPGAPGTPGAANANTAHTPGAPGTLGAANANAAHTPGAPANAPAAGFNGTGHPTSPSANASLHPTPAAGTGSAPQAPATHPQAAISAPPAAQPRPQAAPAAPRPMPMAAAPRPAAPAARAPQPQGGKPNNHRG